MARPLWLVRPRNDGGCDYVNFVPGSASVEMREGSHLPPQMPLLKRRCWLEREEAALGFFFEVLKGAHESLREF